jgi:NADPH-dependent glutamate synthase beta subunit-like oxidoreductase
VVGSGPAGFYAAGHLLDADIPVEVDMIERLPTPWGLVRLGVAPDHPKIKAVSKAFERIAAQPGFRFLGGVDVGRDLRADLMELYDAVVYTVGAARPAQASGENLRVVAPPSSSPGTTAPRLRISGSTSRANAPRYRRGHRAGHRRVRARAGESSRPTRPTRRSGVIGFSIGESSSPAAAAQAAFTLRS